MKAEAKVLGVVFALFWALGVPLRAQPAGAASTATSGGAATPTEEIQPFPAFPAPLASRSLLLAVAPAGDALVAVGEHGDVVRSTDGSRWTQTPCPVRDLLTAVQFVDANQGWAAGHDAVILHTADGGQHWSIQNFQPQLQAPVLNLLMLDAQHGFAVGAFGLLKRTDDGGKTWTDVKAEPIASDQFHLYQMIRLGDGTLLIAAEQGHLYASSDGGTTWNRVKSPYNGSFFGALPVGDKGALIFGLRGHVYLSDDVSADVVLPAPPAAAPAGKPAAKPAASDGAPADDGEGASGDAGAAPGGGNWKTIDAGTTASFFAATRLADGRFVLAGSSGKLLLVSADGSSVKPIPSPTDRDLDAVLPYRGGLIIAGVAGVLRVPSLP